MSQNKPTVPTDPEAAPEEHVEQETPGASPPPHETEKLVPVAEAIRYRKRAQAAEKILGDLQRDLEAKTALLEQREQTLASLERARELDELLVEADAVDLETTRLVAQSALGEMDEPDVTSVVEALVRRKPFLFRTRVVRNGASSPHAVVTGDAIPSELEHAAMAAGTSGRRADLLRYLRLRRRR